MRSSRESHANATGVTNHGAKLMGVVDVHYRDDDTARAALASYDDITMTSPVLDCIAELTDVEPYVPGAFYRRELPGILAVTSLAPPLDLLVIDGYATLTPDGRPGLGAAVFEILKIPVIGVAKTRFRTATHALEVYRGNATRPLYITTVGDITPHHAAHIVQRMAGTSKIPNALAHVDRLARM